MLVAAEQLALEVEPTADEQADDQRGKDRDDRDGVQGAAVHVSPLV
jgi:hypothetical protein